MKFTKYIGLLAIPLLIACNGNTPSSSKDEFTVTWKNYDGTVLEIDRNVKKGTTPTYDSFTPIKESTSKHNYIFLGWTPAVTPVTSDTEYYAQFTPQKICKITWKNYDKSILYTDSVVEGTTPSYDGPTPKMPSTSQGDFIFSNWYPSIGKVSDDTTYTAQYTYRIKGGCNYELNDDGKSYKVVGFTGTSSSSQLKILDTIFDLPVTTIDANAFKSCSNLNSVTIPNTVTTIGDNAFRGCTNLTSIMIPKSVTSISSTAFTGCTGLDSIKVDSDNATYDSRNDCNAIIKKSNNSLILGCKNTEIPDDITSIGDSAFYGCNNFTSLTIPSGVTSIGNSAFNGCLTLESITLPNTLQTIGNSAFNGCSSLSSITFPDSLVSIEEEAFAGCASLNTIAIPKGVTSIGTASKPNPFIGCSSLSSITVDSANAKFTSKDVSDTECNAIIGDNYGDTSILVGCKTTTIPSSTKLNPANVKRIGPYAFSGCKDLSSITFPTPNNVTVIQSYAFKDCTSLTTVTIPSGVTSIGNSIFDGCTSLHTISVDKSNSVYDSRNDCNAIINKSKNRLEIGCKNTKIPNDVTLIGAFAFSGCTNLNSITIPDSVTSLGTAAFSKCTSLTSITLPSGLTQIRNRVFEHCTSLASINIPDGVKTISEDTFNNCKALVSINIPDSVIAIGHSAFLNCSSLTSIVIPKNVQLIYSDTFSGCSSLVSIEVNSANTTFNSKDNCNAIIATNYNYLMLGCKNTTIPNDVTSIGDYAFNECSDLTSITIPNSVISIGDYAFNGCSSLESINIPNSVYSIGNSAFANCTSLSSIDLSEADHVVEIETDTFRNCTSLSTNSIKVNPSLLNDYLYSVGWSCYSEYF